MTNIICRDREVENFGASQDTDTRDEHHDNSIPDSPKSIQDRTGDISKTSAEAGKFDCTKCEKVFRRKCDWTKHMDIHERPYKCEQTQCAKLMGFTYSGGLLRHEREVHGMYGGPKVQLYCPINDCKRNSAEGFKRKENLLEHLRRVHPNSQFDDPVSATTPVSRTSESAPRWIVVNPGSAKRKRGILTNEESQWQPQLPEDVNHEIKKPRSENGFLRCMYKDQQEQLTGLRDEMTKMKQQLEQILKPQQRDAGGG